MYKLLMLLFLAIPNTVLALQINEVMYDAKGSDSGNEYIEIYNPENIWVDYDDYYFISDDKYKQKLRGYDNGTNATYFLIAPCDSFLYKDITNFDLIFNPINLDDFGVPKFDAEGNLLCDKIGNNLKNSVDFIEVWNCEVQEVDIDCSDFDNEDDCNFNDECIWDSDFESCDELEAWCDLEDFFIYNSSMGADGNGLSLQLINNSWEEAIPTPGKVNELIEKERYSIKTNIDDFLLSNIEYGNLFRIKISDKDCRQVENVTVFYNVSNEALVQESNFTVTMGCSKTSGTGKMSLEFGDYTLCGYIKDKLNILDCMDFEVIDTDSIQDDVLIEIITEYDEFEYPDSIKFQPYISDETYPFKIDYWFEDVYGNLLRKKVTTLNTNEKSYRPKINSTENSIVIKANISYIGMDDQDLSNNFAEYSVTYLCTSGEKNYTVDLCLGTKCSIDAIKDFSYNNIFKLTNHGYTPCNFDEEPFNLYYNITKDGAVIISENFNITSMKSTKKVVSWQPSQSGKYTICSELNNITYCFNVTSVDTSTIPCNVSFSLDQSINLDQSGESIKFKFDLDNKTYPFLIDYWVDDLFGNNVKSLVSTSNTNQKSFTKTIDELDRIYLLNANLSFLACNNSDQNTFLNKYFLVKGDEKIITIQNKNSEISINKIYLDNNKTSWGDMFRVNLLAYKNSTSKYSIKSYILNADGKKVNEEDVSLNLKTKNLDYDITFPIQLKPNCNNKYSDGNYTLVLSGLDLNVLENIYVSGESTLCSTEIVEVDSTEEDKKFDYYIVNVPSSVSPGDEFLLDVKLVNDKEHFKEIEIFSYVYRGSKVYSLGREVNKQYLVLDENDDIVVSLFNEMSDNVKEGEYKLKVKLRVDNQKTFKEITKKIIVKKNTPLIKSFKVKDKFIDSAKLVYSSDKHKESYLELKSFLQSKTFSKHDGEVDVKLFGGENIFFLILRDKDKVYDVRELRITNEADKISQIHSLQSIASNIQDITEANKEKDLEIIYESSSRKSLKLVPYFMFFSLLTLTLLLILRTDNFPKV